MAARVEDTIPACGRDVKVKELTVKEIRAWFAREEVRVKEQMEKGASEFDIVEEMLLRDVGLRDFLELTDLTKEEIDNAKPSELRAVMGKCKAVNDDFFVLRAKLLEIGLKALASGNGS